MCALRLNVAFFHRLFRPDGEEVAQAFRLAVASAGWGISNNINTARNRKGKLPIGQSGVLLQVCEGEARLAALSVDRDERLRLRRLVLAPDPARLLHEEPAGLRKLLLEHTAAVLVYEVGRKVLDAVILSLQRLRKLQRRQVHGTWVGAQGYRQSGDR